MTKKKTYLIKSDPFSMIKNKKLRAQLKAVQLKRIVLDSIVSELRGA